MRHTYLATRRKNLYMPDSRFGTIKTAGASRMHPTASSLSIKIQP